LSSVSIIVPFHGPVNLLKECLNALANQTTPACQIIVSVDGASQSIDDINNDPRFVVCTTDKVSGPAVARNKGAALATGDILLFIDADVVCPPDIVEYVANFFSNNRDIAAILGSYDDEPSSQDFFSQYRNLLHHYVHQRSNSDARTFWAGCGAVRKDVFNSIGGFDERYKKPAAEDIELGYRLYENGHKIVLCRDMKVKHLKVWTFKSILLTDLFIRSLSWSRLLIGYRGRYINDLNMDIRSLVCMLIVFTQVMLFAMFLWGYNTFSPIVFLMFIWVWFAYPVIYFYHVCRGVSFAVRAIPMLWLYYLCATLGYILAFIENLFLQGKNFLNKDATEGK
jgi:GT2 family glycosyltransferase